MNGKHEEKHIDKAEDKHEQVDKPEKVETHEKHPEEESSSPVKKPVYSLTVGEHKFKGTFSKGTGHGAVEFVFNVEAGGIISSHPSDDI